MATVAPAAFRGLRKWTMLALAPRSRLFLVARPRNGSHSLFHGTLMTDEKNAFESGEGELFFNQVYSTCQKSIIAALNTLFSYAFETAGIIPRVTCKHASRCSHPSQSARPKIAVY